MNKKIYFIMMVISILAPSLSAQDLIVTTFGDTIPCQIFRMDSISVAFQLIKKDGTKEVRVLARMFVSDFKMEQKNAESSIAIEDSVSRPKIASPNEITWTKQGTANPYSVSGQKLEYTTLRWTLAPGYAKRLSQMTGKGEYAKLFEKLTNGFSWGTELQVFIKKGNGFGLNVSGVHSSGSVEGRISHPNFGTNIDLKIKQRMIYIGPAWTKLFETKNFLFTSNLSLGALLFTEKYDPYGTSAFEDNRTVAGGMNYSLGGEIKISSVCSIGLKTSITLDSVSLFNIGDTSFKSQVPVSWSSFNFAAYISFRN